MRIQKYTRSKAAVKHDEYINTKNLIELPIQYDDLRKKMILIHEKHKNYKTYDYDYRFALDLYELLNSLEWFNSSLASDYDFWRFVCVSVAPNIIEYRHDIAKTEYYYSKNVRMYFPTMYWYIHLCFNNDIETTRHIVEQNNSDTILNLIERPGRKGLNEVLQRKIMYYYWIIIKSKRYNKAELMLIFRKVMVLNLSKLQNVEPVACVEGIDGYVRKLYLTLNIEFDEKGSSINEH